VLQRFSFACLNAEPPRRRDHRAKSGFFSVSRLRAVRYGGQARRRAVEKNARIRRQEDFMRIFAATGMLVLLSVSAFAQQPANPQAPTNKAVR
jgi:hypothetical protein